MIICLYFICVFAVLINKVSLQVTVEGFIGGSVVLSCSSAEDDLKLQDINVHWRHNGSKIVCDIIKGVDSVELQDHRYKKRAETFPEEYLRGNFSIKLNNLQHTDAGKYTCIITPSSELHTVQLIIKESTAGKRNKTSEEEETEVDNVAKSLPSLVWVYILLAITVLIAGVTILYFRKGIKFYRAPVSSVTGEKNSDTNDINGSRS